MDPRPPRDRRTRARSRGCDSLSLQSRDLMNAIILCLLQNVVAASARACPVGLAETIRDAEKPTCVSFSRTGIPAAGCAGRCAIRCGLTWHSACNVDEGTVDRRHQAGGGVP